MALTANRELNRYVDQELRSYPVAASEHVFKGALLGMERATGHVRALQPGDEFVGIAYEEMDNSAGAGADVSVRLYTLGDFVLTVNGATQADAGSGVYALDDEQTSIVPGLGGSYVGVLLAAAGSNAGIVRILPTGAQQVEHALTAPLVSSTAAAVVNPVMIPERAIRVVSAQVSFLTAPDQGNLDVGTTLADPDELVNAFNLATLTDNTPTALVLVGRDAAAGVPILAKVGQASVTAGAGGILSLRYIELP
ncbi:MAG: hypothetical protein ACE5E1_02850 [Phycisphaerae bacterium]